MKWEATTRNYNTATIKLSSSKSTEESSKQQQETTTLLVEIIGYTLLAGEEATTRNYNDASALEEEEGFNEATTRNYNYSASWVYCRRKTML